MAGTSISRPISLCHVIILEAIVELGISAIVNILRALAITRACKGQSWVVTVGGTSGTIPLNLA